MVLRFVILCTMVLLILDLRGHSIELHRIRMQDHCVNNVCSQINISTNDFVILSPSSVDKQRSLTFVNSSIAKIPHLMFDTFPDLQVLRMENCSIERFEESQFERASNIMHLFLGYNQIKDIPKHTFSGADNLQVLHLNNNVIKSIQDNSFDALKLLREMSLAYNKIDWLPIGVFAAMKELSFLNLAGNNLTYIPTGLFDRNANLTHLNLSYNKFKNFESKLLVANLRMKLLDLSGNILQELTLQLERLDTLIAQGCDLRQITSYTIIYELNLKNNSLQDFPHTLYANSVTALDLSLNPLNSIAEMALEQYTSLKSLNLSSCNLHDLPEKVFAKQGVLELLDISSNSLTTLKIQIFYSLKSLNYFYFQENSWNCDFLQLLISSFVKRHEIAFTEDFTAPEFVDDFVDGVACWYESKKNFNRCNCDGSETTMEFVIVRNEIKAFFEEVEKKFFKVYTLLDEIKMHF